MKSYLIMPVLVLFIASCRKETNGECHSNHYLQAYASNVQYVGGKIRFSILTKPNSLVEISGPNGYYYEFIAEDDETTIFIDTASHDHSGQYTVISSKDCRFGTDLMNIHVQPVPTPSCNLPTNVVEQDLYGIYDSIYQYVYGHTVQGIYYQIYGINNSNYRRLNVTFYGTSKPRPGKYFATGHWTPDPYLSCGVHILGGAQSYFMKEDEYVIVEEIDGKLIVSICSAMFEHEFNENQGTVSAKLVLD